MRTATVAAMPNAHSHAFQRDLRGLGERNPDDFWSWRTQMMHLAQALDPEAMRRLAADPKTVAEPSGAVAVAGFLFHRDQLPKTKVNVAIISGGNIEPQMLAEITGGS